MVHHRVGNNLNAINTVRRRVIRHTNHLATKRKSGDYHTLSRKNIPYLNNARVRYLRIPAVGELLHLVVNTMQHDHGQECQSNDYANHSGDHAER